MLSYLLELTVCWSLLYGLYALALSVETFFKINRIYLIFALFIGMIIPFFELPAQSPAAAENAVIYLQTVVIGGIESVGNSAQQTRFFDSIELTDILLFLYFTGVFIFGMRFLYGLYQIKNLYSSSKKIIYQGKKIVLTPENHTPFSFLNFLFVPEDFDLEHIDNQKIIEHECAHLSQRHTIDVLLLEVLSIAFWCVPPIYFFKHSLRQIHEYLADAEVLKNTQKKQYGLLLLRQSHQGRMWLSLANHFNQSQLKKRIMMMTKKPSESKALWKYLAVLPLCFLLVFAFANRENGGSFSPFSLVNDDFNPAEVKAELRKIIENYSAKATETEQLEAYRNLIENFDKLMAEYPAHRKEIKQIAVDVTNEKGMLVAIVRAENSKDLYSIESLRIENPNPVYKKVDEMPRFPGCEDKPAAERKDCAQNEMLNFIFGNVKYPQEARDADIQGTVVTRFVIGANGVLRDVTIVRKIGGGCDEAVLELIAQMPDWIPGKKDGKEVAVEYHLPIKFKLADDSGSEKKPE